MFPVSDCCAKPNLSTTEKGGRNSAPAQPVEGEEGLVRIWIGRQVCVGSGGAVVSLTGSARRRRRYKATVPTVVRFAVEASPNAGDFRPTGILLNVLMAWVTGFWRATRSTLAAHELNCVVPRHDGDRVWVAGRTGVDPCSVSQTDLLG